MSSGRFANDPCPIARTTDVMGDSWTPVLMREFLRGPQRFDQLHERLGLSRATLSSRLERLVDQGMLSREQYQSAPPRYEYVLTEKGLAFWSVLAAMWQFGVEWLFGEDGPTVALKDRNDGHRVKVVVTDEATGDRIDMRSVRMGRA